MGGLFLQGEGKSNFCKQDAVKPCMSNILYRNCTAYLINTAFHHNVATFVILCRLLVAPSQNGAENSSQK